MVVAGCVVEKYCIHGYDIRVQTYELFHMNLVIVTTPKNPLPLRRGIFLKTLENKRNIQSEERNEFGSNTSKIGLDEVVYYYLQDTCSNCRLIHF